LGDIWGENSRKPVFGFRLSGGKGILQRSQFFGCRNKPNRLHQANTTHAPAVFLKQYRPKKPVMQFLPTPVCAGVPSIYPQKWKTPG
ncbi:TPA: hypothetical protein ACLAZC_001860, partial [Neisseria meningitidis]